MYSSRRRSTPFSSILKIIFIGILAGIGFLVYQSAQSDAPPSSAPSAQDLDTLPPSLPNANVQNQTTTNNDTSADPSNAALTAQSDAGTLGDSTLFIPTNAIIAPIVETYLDGTSWDVSQLGMNVGHLQGTSWVNSGPGNIVLSAHVEMRDGRAGPFSHIADLQIGDRIFLNHGEEQWQYAIVQVMNVEPTDLTPLYPSQNELLTLITCDSYDFFRNTYQERTVVVAERIS
jgi:LPXTG-site transpeptidase (sortase) family protein